MAYLIPDRSLVRLVVEETTAAAASSLGLAELITKYHEGGKIKSAKALVIALTTTYRGNGYCE